MAKHLEATLSDGKSRTIQVPHEVSLDDFHAVLQWTRTQEWLWSEEGNAAVRRDAVIELRVVELSDEPLVASA
jgi:hypothetical protein